MKTNTVKESFEQMMKRHQNYISTQIEKLTPPKRIGYIGDNVVIFDYSSDRTFEVGKSECNYLVRAENFGVSNITFLPERLRIILTF